MRVQLQHKFKLKPLAIAVGLALYGAGAGYAEDATITKSATISDPLGATPVTAAPGDTINYSITIDDNSAAGEFLHGIDIEDALPAGTENYLGGSITGSSVVRIFRDNIELGDGFDADVAPSGNDGNSNFTGDWVETTGNGGGETDGIGGGDEIMETEGGRYVIRIRDDNGPLNDRGEGVYRIANLSSCTVAILTFEIAGDGLDNSTDGIYLDESTDGTSWTELVYFDLNETTTAGSLTDPSRDIVNNTFQEHAVALSVGSTTSYIRFITDDDNGNGDGAWIDNVQITAICESASPTIGSPSTLLASTVYDGVNYGLDDAGSLVATYSVEVSEGRETDITNDAQVLYTDLVGNATTIGGTEQTGSNTSATNTVSLVLRDDFGDAPETDGYTTLLANDGPRHVAGADVYLGDIVGDADSGGFADGTQGAGNASEDDGDNNADEGIAQLLSSGDSSFPELSISGSSYSLTLDLTNSATSAATLFGWIDFDGDGNFDEDELATDSIGDSVGTTTGTLTWNNIGGSGPDINLGTTYARFRLTTDTSLVIATGGDTEDPASLGFAFDGEVEDYQIEIVAPVCYAAYSDASIAGTVFSLIPLSPTATGSQADFDVLTNNNDGDDENFGMVFTTTLVVPTTGNYEFRLNSDDGSQLYIDGQLVVDYDGDHGANGPVIVTGVPLDAGNRELQIFYYENGGGNSLTVEWDGSGSIAPIGGADIAPPASCPADPDFPLDWGDADAAYSDAYHAITFDDDYSIGSVAPDTETSQQSSVGADGDDNLGTDDEDADPDLSGLDNTYTGNYVVSVPVANSGVDATLGGWIDFDGDNLFETGEYASETVTSADTSVDLTFDTNAVTVTAGTTYARFRMSREAITGADANGFLAGGEVEDYSLTIADASQVYFEAECGIAGVNWTANYDAAASESTYIETTNNTTTDPTGAQPDADLVQYNINVPIAGTYDLYVLANFPGAADDSVYLSSDNNNWTEMNNTSTTGWEWLDSGLNLTSSGGAETIYIHYRENGSLLDKFALTATGAPTGQGNDVGSCFDFGDDSGYNTDLVSGGPYHAVDGQATVYLGDTTPDTEDDALENAAATGDDANDEGAGQILSGAQTSFPSIIPTDTSYSVEIDVFNNVDSVNSTDALLFAWIDWDMDGVFEETELADSAPFTIANGASNQTQTIDWTGLSGLSAGTTTARFRVSTDTQLTAGSNGGEDEASLGVAIDGEVEDHQISITTDDYGDAPSVYGDAIHTFTASPTLYLGPSIPDAEAVSQQGGDAGVGADGDDGDGNDDESSINTVPILNTSQIGQTYSVDVVVVNSTDDASADLFGWIDFDGDNVFDTDEAVTINTPTTAVYQLDWTVPPDLQVGDTYIRLRLTSDGSVTTSTPTGAAADGEVEDYSLIVTDPVDFGDAIDSGLGAAVLDYRTSLADDGARHLLSANLYLGDTVADADGDALDNGAATGDDFGGDADEGVAQLLTTAQGDEFPDLAVADTSLDFDIDLTNATTGAANLYVWIDYDHNGSFDEDELAGGAPISVSNGATSASISSTPTGDTIVGNTYMRLRLTTDTLASGPAGGEDERSYGLASDGEVEDYRIEISGLDFGDAPDSYGTDKTNDGSEGIGPSHVQTGTLYIGTALPDLDSDGVPSTNAAGDDLDGDDEGGFFIPVLSPSDTSYSISLPVINNTGSDATLFGWLDFNENGTFDSGEAVSTTVTSGSTSATLTGWTFSALSGTETYLRLRLTTDSSITAATPGGAASDGEVEDHLVVIGGLDFGDAPDTYSTDSTAGNDGSGNFDEVGASHGVTSGLYIGSSPPDSEADGQPSSGADGDDLLTSDDEAALTLPLLTPATETYSISVEVSNTLGVPAELVGWIDFDSNGFFDNDEGARVEVPDSATSVNLVWNNIPGDIVVADPFTFLRLRITTDDSIATGDASTSSPKGPAANGEVEDHPISIEVAYDYGDAPDTYGTDGTNDLGEGFGPRHIISPLLYLGSFAPDAESDGQASSDALLDDNTGTGEGTPADSTDGDEGDLFVTTIQPDQTSYTLSVPLTNATGSSATLYGWLDLNQDGDFNDANESQSSTVLAGSSFGTLIFTWSSGDTSGGNGLDNGSTFLRLRLSSEAGLGPTEALVTDYADDGEVEDYRVQVSQLTCDLLYGVYNNGGYTRLREFDNDTVDLATTSFQSAGIGIERNYRRFYYVEWPTGTNRDLFYFDPTGTPTEVNTGASIATSGNYNRMAFAYDGRGVIVESGNYNIHLFDPTVSGTGQTITNAITMTNEASILGGGGDIAFDRDDNLYMVTYTTGGGAEFYLYEIRFFEQIGGAEVQIPDLVLTGSPETTYEATATLLLTEANTTGAQIAGMAFNFDNLIYLQGASANTTFTWDVGITATGGTGAVQALTGTFSASADLASCIYPYIRAIIEPVKTVVNETSGGAGFLPGDVLEYTVVVRNSGGFPSFGTLFQDDIQPGTTYVPNSTTMNGDVLPDTGGLMPFVVGREVHTDGEADGTVLADITPGIIGDNEVVITYKVRVDLDGSGTEICNQGFVDYEANLSPAIPTNDPGTGAADDATCLSQTSGFSVSGILYEDYNVDGIQSGSEPGIEGVTMVLYDSVGGSCESTLTNANGFYEFPSVSAGPKTVFEVSGESVPVPASCPPSALGSDPSGYLSSSTNSSSIYVVNADVTELDFGDVRLPALTPNLEGVVTPGATQTYSHLFRAPTNGSVSFAAVSIANPVVSGWSSLVFEDVDCSGDLSSGDYQIVSSINMVAGESICLLNRVFAPTIAVPGNTLLSDLTATFNYDGSLVSDQNVEANDLTTVLDSADSALQLTKRVRNITEASTEFDSIAAISNTAKPGDRLRYEISFSNTGVGNISDIDIYDSIPAFTGLAEVLDLNCAYSGPLSGDISAVIPSTLSCDLIKPAIGENLVGYGGSLHWQLDGILPPGETGLIIFTVDVQ